MHEYEQNFLLLGFEGPISVMEDWGNRLDNDCHCRCCQGRPIALGQFATSSENTGLQVITAAVDPRMLPRLIMMAGAMRDSSVHVAVRSVNADTLMAALSTAEKLGWSDMRFNANCGYDHFTTVYTFTVKSLELTMTGLMQAMGNLISRYLVTANSQLLQDAGGVDLHEPR